MGKSLRVTNGKETLEIDASDLNDAVKDGYRPTERIIVANPKTKESFEIAPEDYQHAMQDGFNFSDIVGKDKTTPTQKPLGPTVNFSNPIEYIAPDFNKQLESEHQYEVAAAQERIDKALQKSDPAIKSFLLRNKKQTESLKLQDRLQQRGVDATSANINLSKIQDLIPKASIHVSDGEVQQIKESLQQDPELSREILREHAKLNPSESRKIAADVYLIDSKNRANGGNIGQIRKNKEGIESGENEYSIWHGGTVKKPEGLIPSLGRGYSQRQQQFNDYDFLQKSKDQDIINEYEKRINTPRNEEEPEPVPSGFWGGLGHMAGAEGPTLAKGALPGILDVATGGGATPAVPWLSALLTSPDFYERGYANSFAKHYADLRSEGHTPEEALKEAKNRASFDAKADVAMGVAMSASAAKMTPAGAITGKFSKGFLGAAKAAAKEIVASTPEAGGIGAFGGATQIVKNLHSGKPWNEDVVDATITPILFHYGIKTIGAGAKVVGQTLFKSSLSNMARQPEQDVNKAIGEQVESGEIPPEKATEIYNAITEKRAQDQELVDKAKEIVAAGKVSGISAEPLKDAALNDPTQFLDHLKRIADEAHDPKTAEHTAEVFGEDLVKVAKQLYPHEDISAQIDANRKADIEEIDNEIKKLNPESRDYPIKKRELIDRKKVINNYYDNQQKHHDIQNTPTVESVDDNVVLPTEKAKLLLEEGLKIPEGEKGHIGKEYEDLKDHPQHLMSFINDEIDKGGEKEMKAEFGDQLVKLAKENKPEQSRISIVQPGEIKQPEIITIKPKDNAVSITSPEEMGTHNIGAESARRESEGSGMGSGQQGNEATGESQKAIEGTTPPIENDLPFRDEPGDESITGIRNSITAKKIEESGLTPALKEAARTHPKVWQEALAKVKKGYDIQTQLIDKLKKKARPLTDTEDALLLIHQVQKESELDSLNRQITEAGQKGDEAELAELQLQKLKVKDDLQDIYDIDKAVGTANARGLSARKMIADRKYSLVNMEMEARAARNGKPLTEEESAEVEKKYNEIKAANDAYQKRLSELEAENKQLKAEKAVKKEASGSKKPKKGKAEYTAKRDEILKQMRDDLLRAAKGGEGLTASIPFAAQLKAVAPHVAKLVKLYVEQGIDNIERITKEIYAILKPQMPELEESHVHDLIAGEFDPKAPREGEPVNDQGIPLPIKEQAKQIKYAITDPELMKLRANYERAKEAWGDEMRRKELAGRSRLERIQDTFIKWQRFFKLSGITTMGKLLTAAGTRLSTTPIEEVVGEGYSQLLPRTAARATGEGRLNIQAEAKAIASAFTKGIRDSADILSKKKRGKSDIEAIFGKGGELPPEALGFFGQLHSATKAPVKRAAFERSMAKRIAANLKAGVDVSDPMVQSKIAIQAYKDANRAIFMQDNFISDSYRNFVNSLERSKKYPAQGKIAATALQWLIPFVKVPTNIVGEVGTNAAGVPIAAAKLIHTAFTKGIENLSEDEADMIMRNLKKGSIGAGALLLGYFKPENFGGYYEKYEKRKEGDLKAGQTRAFGLTIPIWLQESPIFQTMQLGATVRRLQDGMLGKQPEGFTHSAFAAALGLAEHEPLIDQPARIMEAIKNPREREYFVGELAKGTIVPAGLSNIAQWTDPASARKPETVLEHIKTGIPGLREQVPKKPETPEEIRAAKEEKKTANKLKEWKSKLNLPSDKYLPTDIDYDHSAPKPTGKEAEELNDLIKKNRQTLFESVQTDLDWENMSNAEKKAALETIMKEGEDAGKKEFKDKYPQFTPQRPEITDEQRAKSREQSEKEREIQRKISNKARGLNGG